MTPRPNQSQGVGDLLSAIDAGKRRNLVVSPTGGGKTLMMALSAKHYLDAGEKVVLYTNRRALLDQTSDVFMDQGMYHGVRAAGYADEREHPFQISSIQTEHRRCMKSRRWELHNAALVIVDEAHMQKEDMARAIFDRHTQAGAAFAGFTATPLDLGDLYDNLIIAGTVSELRGYGALVPAHHFAPDEPEIKGLKAKPPEGDNFSEAQQRQLMGAVGKDGRANRQLESLYGRVWDNFEKLNPKHLPTILFAPGVNESIWFAEQFSKKGVPAAHIDGDDIWIDGEMHRSSTDLRRRLVAMSRSGEIRVLTNRFVMREGIDLPWLRHVIAANVFGSLQAFLQSLGRGLRADHYEDTVALFGPKEIVSIQDHGGNWWRHGSLNEDRDWFLEQTGQMAYGLRAERIRAGKQAQPFRCPKCGHTWRAGRECKQAWGGCGFVLASGKFSRPVITCEGALREMTGAIFKPRSLSRQLDGPYRWQIMLRRSRTAKGRRTFRAAATMFAMENNWQYPDPRWPGMPTNERDWFRMVDEVPRERLTCATQPV